MKKLINISESKLSESTSEVVCPHCRGEHDDCKFCKGNGKVTVSKNSRYKSWVKNHG